MSAPAPQPAPPSTGARIGSFIGWAFLLSLVIHAVLLPFVQLKSHSEDKQEVTKISETKKIKVQPPTPPPPTPTPPPPTPLPKATPPPVKATHPPPPPKQLVVKPPKTTSKSETGPSERKADTSKPVSEEGVPQGSKEGSAAPAPQPVSTAPPAPPAPTPTPKPACANPNAPATIKGTAADAEYPDIARQQGAVGTATVKVTLTASGSVSDASINKSAGNPALDRAAIDAAKATQYIAETVNCVPSAGSYLFQVDFTGQ